MATPRSWQADRARRRVAKALTIARRERVTLNAARADLRKAGEPVSMASIKRYAPGVIEKDAFGRWRARRDRGDRLPRRMRVISTEGVAAVEIRGSRVASLNADHANAVKAFISGESDGSDLARFQGKYVGGHRLETNLDGLDARARTPELDFLDL